MKRLLIIFLFISTQSFATIRIGIPDDVYLDFLAFMRGRTIESIESYEDKFSRRDVVETVLILRMLKLGGHTGKISFVPMATYKRLLREVSSGNVDLAATSVWESDIKDHEKGPVLVNEGEFEAGIYTSHTASKVRDLIQKAQLNSLTAVTSIHWKEDVLVLKSLDLKYIFYAPLWTSMVKLVSLKRYDFLMANLPNKENMDLIGDGYHLKVVEGVKVKLRGQRVVAYSKKAPKELKDYLFKGAKILRENGEIKKAYTESGFFSHMAKDWKVLNQD